MKKFFAAILIALALSTTGMANTEDQNPQAPQPLPNFSFDHVFYNDDGSVSIQYPKVVNVFPNESKRYPIHEYSHPGGLCKALGYQSFVSNTLGICQSPLLTEIISVNFTTYFGEPRRAFSWVSFITCTNLPPLKVSSRVDRIVENSTGVVTLVNPRFRYKGQDRQFSVIVSKNGLCRLFGFSEYAGDHTIHKTDQKIDRMDIAKDGRFRQLRASLRYIKSLTCRR